MINQEMSIESAIEHIIREEIFCGEFDNMKSNDKPLDLDDLFDIREGVCKRYSTLIANDPVPEEVERRKSMLENREKAQDCR